MPDSKRRRARANAPANQLWGGRYAAGPAAVMTAINASIDVDRRLWREDIQGSLAHVAMLARQGIVRPADASRITRGLKKVAAATSFPFPILNGEALALDLRIHRYPTFVFVAPTTKERYRLDGLRTPEEIEKVIRLMKGGR